MTDINDRVWLIGSAPICDIVVPGSTVSGRHCRITLAGGDWMITDLDSANGVYVDGARIDAPTRVMPHQTITLGRRIKLPWPSLQAASARQAPDGVAKVIRIGRDQDNDVVLDHPSVSGRHARILLNDRGAILEDLASRNGTGLNSSENRIRRERLNAADVIFFGAHPVPASTLLPPAEPEKKPDAAPAAAASLSATEELWKPELASVLFLDIVGFTTLNPSGQVKARRDLESCVQSSAAFTRARRENIILVRPTGDGVALVFFSHPSTAAECAAQIAAKLRGNASLAVRMGINHGTVYRMKDLNGNDDVSGSGINIAQRVMDCGNPGQIVVSAPVADALKGTMDWHEFIQPLGPRTIKHGDVIEIFNLCGPDFGQSVQSPA